MLYSHTIVVDNPTSEIQTKCGCRSGHNRFQARRKLNTARWSFIKLLGVWGREGEESSMRFFHVVFQMNFGPFGFVQDFECDLSQCKNSIIL